MLIRALNRATPYALLAGCAGALLWLVSIMLHVRYMPSIEAPYPTFGGSFATCFEVLAALYFRPLERPVAGNDPRRTRT